MLGHAHGAKGRFRWSQELVLIENHFEIMPLELFVVSMKSSCHTVVRTFSQRAFHGEKNMQAERRKRMITAKSCSRRTRCDLPHSIDHDNHQ